MDGQRDAPPATPGARGGASDSVVQRSLWDALEEMDAAPVASPNPANAAGAAEPSAARDAPSAPATAAERSAADAAAASWERALTAAQAALLRRHGPWDDPPQRFALVVWLAALRLWRDVPPPWAAGRTAVAWEEAPDAAAALAALLADLGAGPHAPDAVRPAARGGPAPLPRAYPCAAALRAAWRALQDAPPDAVALAHALGAAHAALLNDSGAARADADEYPTPPPIARLLARLAQPLRSGVTVVDPTCGDGALLVAAAQEARAAGTMPTFAGVELRARSAWLAALRLALLGVRCRIRVGDALAPDPWPAGGVTLANPPFRHATAILARILDRMDADDRAVVIMPVGFAFRSGDAATLRRRPAESGRLRAVLALPSGAFAPATDAATLVLVIGAPMPGSPITWAAPPESAVGVARRGVRRRRAAWDDAATEALLASLSGDDAAESPLILWRTPGDAAHREPAGAWRLYPPTPPPRAAAGESLPAPAARLRMRQAEPAQRTDGLLRLLDDLIGVRGGAVESGDPDETNGAPDG
jgi:hypothetical protein